MTVQITPFDFVGDWSIKRTIEDAKSNSTASFVGKAQIVEGHKEWVYSEQGELALATGAQFFAERKYFWHPNETGFDVFFEDKRFFHSFELGSAAQAQHWCDPDQYEVAYEFQQWPIWKSTWQVTGPRKNYVMSSQFQPAN